MACIMTLQDLRQALGKSTDEVNELIRTHQMPGHLVGDNLWRVDPFAWDAYLIAAHDDADDEDFFMLPFDEAEPRVWEKERGMRDDDIGGFDEILGLLSRHAGKNFLSPREALDEFLGFFDLMIEAADTVSADKKVQMHAAIRELGADPGVFEVFARFYWAAADRDADDER
jgi:hypothetical protein